MRGGKRRDMGGERTGSGRKKEQQKKHKKGGEEGTKYESMRVGVESTLQGVGAEGEFRKNRGGEY